jgi:hypothetical protein
MNMNMSMNIQNMNMGIMNMNTHDMNMNINIFDMRYQTTPISENSDIRWT